MIFKETTLKGAYVIELERLQDERGFFARSFCQEEFEEHGLNPHIVQCNISYNKKKGTLRNPTGGTDWRITFELDEFVRMMGS